VKSRKKLKTTYLFRLIVLVSENELKNTLLMSLMVIQLRKSFAYII